MTGTAPVETTLGKVCGSVGRGVEAFLGVPYAAPTGGSARFRAPEPAQAWTGVRHADAFGDGAPQPDPRTGMGGAFAELLDLLHPRGGTSLEGGRQSEDCLSLNIWRPRDHGVGPLPVYVWFHGGGWLWGFSGESHFNGAALARTGRAVVVTVGQRLGALGFLRLDHLLGEDYADAAVAGILDQVAALRWVRDNIAAFGGDPGRVTIGGQSGGGEKVLAMLEAPAAAGLFHRAIVQSTMNRPVSVDDGIATTDDFLRSAGLDRRDARMLLEWPWRRVLDAQSGTRWPVRQFRPSPRPGVLDALPFTDNAAPARHRVPLLVGSATHDSAFMLTENDAYEALDDSGLLKALESLYPGRGSDLHDLYRTAHPEESPQLRLARARTDAEFGRVATQIAERATAEGLPVFQYRFDFPTDALRGLLGSCHSLDLPFTFKNVGTSPLAGSSPDRFAVSDTMVDAWLSFIETGTPVLPDGRAWPRYDDGTGHRTVVIGRKVHTETDVTTAERTARFSQETS
ncbi:carboxylesterase/lipase family protein [Streptomyces sp. NPDC003011]